MSINLRLFDIKTQNLNVRSNTKRFLGKSKKNWEKKLLEPDAFSEKQYFKNWQACNLFAIWLRTSDGYLCVFSLDPTDPRSLGQGSGGSLKMSMISIKTYVKLTVIIV